MTARPTDPVTSGPGALIFHARRRATTDRRTIDDEHASTRDDADDREPQTVRATTEPTSRGVGLCPSTPSPFPPPVRRFTPAVNLGTQFSGGNPAMTTPDPPEGLQTRGRHFWIDTLTSFDLSDAEQQVLTEVCRTLDNLDDLANVIERDGPTTTGSTGQVVVHPALTEARGQRLVMHRLLAALQLPDEEGQTITTATQTRAKTASRARWTRSSPRAV